ncbi:MAG: hypothetical protein WCJ55_10350 [Chloroflexales bacterium]
MAKRHQAESAPELPAPIWKRHAISIIESQIVRHPLLVQLRTIWRQLQGEREIWPYLVPLLVLVSIRTYRAERRKLRNQLS